MCMNGVKLKVLRLRRPTRLQKGHVVMVLSQTENHLH
jgi:hypothetical protein